MRLWDPRRVWLRSVARWCRGSPGPRAWQCRRRCPHRRQPGRACVGLDHLLVDGELLDAAAADLDGDDVLVDEGERLGAEADARAMHPVTAPAGSTVHLGKPAVGVADVTDPSSGQELEERLQTRKSRAKSSRSSSVASRSCAASSAVKPMSCGRCPRSARGGIERCSQLVLEHLDVEGVRSPSRRWIRIERAISLPRPT